MDHRPLSAPPQPPPPHLSTILSPVRTEDIERRAKSSNDRESSPDSIEKAANLLFNRVRALITPSSRTEESQTQNNLASISNLLTAAAISRPSSRGSNSSVYFGDEGSANSVDTASIFGGSNASKKQLSAQVTRPPSALKRIESGRVSVNYNLSDDPDVEDVVRIGSVVQRSVASSIVNESNLSSPHFPYYSRTGSVKGDDRVKSPSRRFKSRKLGRMTPSPGGSKVGTIGAVDEVASSEDEYDGNPENVSGGLDPEKIRKKLLSRPTTEPIKPDGPIVQVVYDHSSSSTQTCPGTPANGLTTPDLFARPLNLESPLKRDPHTPINTIASATPMIGVITPSPQQSGYSNEQSDEVDSDLRDSVEYSKGTVLAPNGSVLDESTSTIIAHTGASTPDDVQPGTITINDGSTSGHRYEENEEREEIKKMSVQGKLNKAYSSDAFAGKSSYDDTDPPAPRVLTTLHEDYKRGNQKHQNSYREPTRSPSKSRRATSRGSSRARSPVGDSQLTSHSFSRIITDLEEMLNQALELAGRAVADSSSALDQRDASERASNAGSNAGSRCETVDDSNYGTARQDFTEPGSQVELPKEEELRREATDQWTPLPTEANQSQQLTHLNTDSSTAVYADGGEPSSENLGQRLAVPSTTPITMEDKRSRSSGMTEKPWKGQSLPGSSKEFLSEKGRKSSAERSSRRSKSGRGTMTTTTFDAETFRMEVGRSGEIILVRIPGTKPSSNAPSGSGAREGSTGSRRHESFGRPGYRGGWEWGVWGKRFASIVACAVVGLIGWIIGNYFAELSEIQTHLEIGTHVSSLGNSMFFLALALTTLLLWPLPLLHGRKPYLLMSLSLLLPLQLPQALSLPPYTVKIVDSGRPMQPYVACLLVFRVFSGAILGFAFINTFPTIMDLFGPDTGACCRGGVVYNSRIPVSGQNQFHQVPGGEKGVRIGIWLGVYTWLLTSAPGFGFLFGKITISQTTPAWGFWIIAILGGIVLILIILVPEVRPPWRKVRLTRRTSRHRRTGRSARIEQQHVERGELKLVMIGNSPKWWWEEVAAGLILSGKMLTQLGFMTVAIYVGWVFGHLCVVMRLLSSLITLQYRFRPTDIGLAILAMPLGALLSIPTQLSLFYLVNFRHRSSVAMNNRNYGHRHQGQHPYRRALWIGGLLLPIASMALSVSATGPPTHFMIPVFFAAIVSFSGTLVIAECYLILLDNFDISDLPEPYLSSANGSISQGANNTGYPHGTQRPSSLSGSEDDRFTTSHPCLSSGLAIAHALAFVFGAMAVGISNHIVENIGVRRGLGLMTGVTAIVTLALSYVLWRNKDVRLAEVFDNDENEVSVKVSLLQRGWGTRWTEVNGMEWWEDASAV